MARVFTKSETSSATKSLSASIKSSRCSRPLPRHPIARRFLLLGELLRDLGKRKMHSRELHIPLRPMSKERPRSFQGQSRPYMSRNYKLWMKDCIAVMQEWWVGPPLQKVKFLEIEHHGAARGDLDNKDGSVMDALVKAGVIKDDNVNIIDDRRSTFHKAKVKEAHIIVRLEWE
jgi:Holliday junction resolvase RusA-like endonuclease